MCYVQDQECVPYSRCIPLLGCDVELHFTGAFTHVRGFVGRAGGRTQLQSCYLIDGVSLSTHEIHTYTRNTRRINTTKHTPIQIVHTYKDTPVCIDKQDAAECNLQEILVARYCSCRRVKCRRLKNWNLILEEKVCGV